MLKLSLKNISGFSLVEVLVATGVSSIVALGSGAVIIQAVKSEQRAQALADAARAGDVLRNVVFKSSRAQDACSNTLQVDGFNAGNLDGAGIPLGTVNIPALGGDINAGCSETAPCDTPYGQIVGFRLLGADGDPEFEDVDGNEVYSGVVQLKMRKAAGFPATPIYLGSLGVRIDPADNSFQGCANTLGETGIDLHCPGGTGTANDFLDGADVSGTCSFGTDFANNSLVIRETSTPANCPLGQAVIAVDRDMTLPPGAENSNPMLGALIECQNIVEAASCGCDSPNDSDCADDDDRPRALTGIGNDGGAQCARLPNDVSLVQVIPTPTPDNSLPVTTPTLPSPIPPPPPPTAYPTPEPTPTPRSNPPPPPPNNNCSERTVSDNCQEICIYEGWLGLGSIGNNCFNVCPSVANCPVPVVVPTVTVVPSPTPYSPPPQPTPVNNQCLCGGMILEEGDYCGPCIQLFEPELGMFGRSYRYINRTQSHRCVNGNLVLGGINPNGGDCPDLGGRIPYERW